MSEIHQKTINITEERVIQNQEMKRQNKDLYEQNMSMSN